MKRFHNPFPNLLAVFVPLTWQDDSGRFLAIADSPREACRNWKTLHERMRGLDSRIGPRPFEIARVRPVTVGEIDDVMATRRGRGAAPNAFELPKAAREGYLLRYVDA